MFIQTEQTPNPSTLKFLPGRVVMDKGTMDFAGADGPQSTVGQAPVRGRGRGARVLRRRFRDRDQGGRQGLAGPEALDPGRHHGALHLRRARGRGRLQAGDASADDDEVVAQIKDLLETRVRPAVAQDGGDIVYQDFRDGVVYLQMQGSCSGCPSSTATLKMGIENLLKHYVPEVVEVQAVQ